MMRRDLELELNLWMIRKIESCELLYFCHTCKVGEGGYYLYHPVAFCNVLCTLVVDMLIELWKKYG